jgi:ATP-dependent helicase HrpA
VERVTPGTLPELPLELHLGDIAGLPVRAWPGLKAGPTGVALKLYPDMDTALAHSRAGMAALCAEALGRELGWLQRDLAKETRRVALGFAAMMDSKALAGELYALIGRDLLACEEPLPLSPARLRRLADSARERLRGLAPRAVDQLQDILDARDRVIALAGDTAAWRIELDALVHVKFLRPLDLARLRRYPVYLEALARRIERARLNPARDAAKARPLLPLIRRYGALKAAAPVKRSLRWLLEEYKVQIFAQELGTAGKVSDKVIEAAFAAAEDQARRKA